MKSDYFPITASAVIAALQGHCNVGSRGWCWYVLSSKFVLLSVGSQVALTIDRDVEGARKVLESVAALGIDMEEVAQVHQGSTLQYCTRCM